MSDTQSLEVWMQYAAGKIEKAGSDTPHFDARLLLCDVVKLSTSALISRGREVLTPLQVEQLSRSLERRLQGEPVHRILGWREFYGRRFEISAETLVPRPDTETLVEAVLRNEMHRARPIRMLDIGTGSGILAVTLAAELPDLQVVATDISENALATALNNARNLEVSGQIEFKNSNLFQDVEGAFDLIVSNPPYIPDGDIKGLQKEVRLYDPCAALAGGPDGLNFYRAIFANSKDHLCDGGAVFVEIGAGQHEAVCQIASENGFNVISVVADLNGIKRVIGTKAR